MSWGATAPADFSLCSISGPPPVQLLPFCVPCKLCALGAELLEALSYNDAPMKTFDAMIIGTGQSGPSLAARLAAAGMSVAVIERHRFGGTCVNNGCIPTKAMV